MFKSRRHAAGVGAALTLAVLVGAIPASGANLLPNGGFDATAAGSLTGWQWAKATASVTLVAGKGSGHAAQVGVAGTATSYQVYASPRPVSSAAVGSGFVAAGI